MIDQERFAKNIRDAGAEWQQSEIDLAKAEAAEKKMFAILQFRAQTEYGHKSIAAQSSWADSQDEMEVARINRGVAKGALAAAKANYEAAQTEFKAWQSKEAARRAERRVYES